MERGRFYQQFGERSGSGESFSVDKPIDLVGSIRGFIEQEKASHSRSWVDRYFNAAWFLRKEMRSIMYVSTGQNEPEEKGLFFDDLHIAWGLVAWDKLEGYQDTVYEETQTYLGVMQSFGRVREGRMQLSPAGVTLLDAMSEAIGIEHTPGQDTFDLSLFRSTEAMARIERGQNRLPTSEEVKRAISTSRDAGK
jgi:hypothetical protein